jgi:hypothetical protein
MLNGENKTEARCDNILLYIHVALLGINNTKWRTIWTETNRVFVPAAKAFYFTGNSISGSNGMLIIEINEASCPFVRKTRDTRLLRPMSDPPLASISSSLHLLLSSS